MIDTHRRKTVGLAFFVLVLAAIGLPRCGKDNPTDTQPGVTLPLVPMKIGNQWTYSCRDSFPVLDTVYFYMYTKTVTIIDDTVIGGKVWYGFQTELPPDPSDPPDTSRYTEYRRIDSLGIWGCRVWFGDSVFEEILLYTYPAAIGDSALTVRWQTQTSPYTYLSIEDCYWRPHEVDDFCEVKGFSYGTVRTTRNCGGNPYIKSATCWNPQYHLMARVVQSLDSVVVAPAGSFRSVVYRTTDSTETKNYSYSTLKYDAYCPGVGLVGTKSAFHSEELTSIMLQ